MNPRVERFKAKVRSAKPIQLILKTIQKWQRDECSEMGAALSYYALFSLFPMFLVILSIVGFFLGPNAQVVDQLLAYVKTALPPMAYEIFEDSFLHVLSHLNESRIGSGITGSILLLVTSSNVFGALDRSVDKIWRVYDEKRNASSLKKSVATFFLDRLLAFLLVLCASIVMLCSLLSSIVFKAVRELLKTVNHFISFIDLDEVLIFKNIQLGATFLILCAIILILFKILPSTPVHWGDVWIGGLITTSLLLGLQQLISNSIIQIGSEYQSYGLVGGVMVLMVWIYLTCQIFFIGSAFTYVYAHLYGSRRDRPPAQRLRQF